MGLLSKGLLSISITVSSTDVVGILQRRRPSEMRYRDCAVGTVKWEAGW